MSALERFVTQAAWAAIARELHALAGVQPRNFADIHRHHLLVKARFYVSRNRARWAAMVGPATCQNCGANV